MLGFHAQAADFSAVLQVVGDHDPEDAPGG